jgi:hypothetical protein
MAAPGAALDRLRPLIGAWRLETSLAAPAGLRARATFEWALGGAFLLQRTEIDVPDAPDSLAVIAVDPATGGYTQHYFDSRGVVRVYAMTFDGVVWTLLRQSPDFSALQFEQRFVGTVADDGGSIRGRWEARPPGGTDWERDFDLTYVREPASSG